MLKGKVFDWQKLQGFNHVGEDSHKIRRDYHSRKVVLDNNEEEQILIHFHNANKDIILGPRTIKTIGLPSVGEEIESITLFNPKTKEPVSYRHYLRTDSNMFSIRKGTAFWTLTYFRTPSLRA